MYILFVLFVLNTVKIKLCKDIHVVPFITNTPVRTLYNKFTFYLSSNLVPYLSIIANIFDTSEYAQPLKVHGSPGTRRNCKEYIPQRKSRGNPLSAWTYQPPYRPPSPPPPPPPLKATTVDRRDKSTVPGDPFPVV